MSWRHVGAGLLATAGLAGLLNAAAARGSDQTPARASVQGQVVLDDASETPVEAALVTLVVDTALPPLAGVTDRLGRFLISGIKPGRYRLTASKPGFVAASYGALRPGGAGVLVTAVAGSSTPAVLRLSPGASIVGSTRSLDGQPVAGLDVSAVAVDGTRSGRAVAHAYTDERGEFRLFGIARGRYVVLAARSGGLPDPVVLSRDDVDDALAALGKNVMPAVDRSAGVGRSISTSVYYPDSFDPGGATILDISRGQTLTGIDIIIRPASTGRLEGRLAMTDADLPLRSVALVQRGSALPSGARRAFATTPRADGTFTFDLVPPGSYSLLARLWAPTRGDASSTADRSGLWGRSTVIVSPGMDQVAVVVPMEIEVSLEGRIAAQGGQRLSAASLRVSLVHEDDTALLDAVRRGTVPTSLLVPAAEVLADGQFVLKRLTTGQYDFVVSGLPDGWSVAAAEFGGNDALDAALQIGSTVPQGGLTITVAPETEITGAVFPNGAGEAAEYSVVAFPADRARWVWARHRIQIARADANGRFVAHGLPAGDYLLRAVPSGDEDALLDPAGFELLSRGAVRVHLDAGERKAQDVMVRGGTGSSD